MHLKEDRSQIQTHEEYSETVESRSMKLVIHNKKISGNITSLAKQLGMEMNSDCGECYIRDEKDAKIFRGIDFAQGLSLFISNYYQKEDLDLNLTFNKMKDLTLFFNQGEEIEISDVDSGQICKVSPGEMCIFDGKRKGNYEFLNAGEHTKFLIVWVDKEKFIEKSGCELESLPDEIKQLLEEKDAGKTFQYTTSFNPAVAKSVRKIFGSEEINLENKLFLESKALELLTYIFKNFRIEKSENQSNYKFTEEDFRQIKNLAHVMKENVANKLTVKELAKLSGINQNKLQIGFKLTHGKTINQYLVKIRLEAAHKLLEEGKYSVADVAEKVGYTNKGYFAKIFHEEFGSLPSDLAHE